MVKIAHDIIQPIHEVGHDAAGSEDRIFYRGDANEQGVPYGKGLVINLDDFGEEHIVYEGDFVNGKKHGVGMLYYFNGECQYSGEFRDGLEHGKGHFYDPSGAKRYNGDYQFGKEWGTGVWFHAGTKQPEYKGEWEQGVPHGTGTLFLEDGQKRYYGGWVKGEFHGTGELYNRKGKVTWRGQFKDGVPITDLSYYLSYLTSCCL